MSRSATKTVIGKFYVSIDPELQTKSICTCPDSVYQFIERVASSKKPCSTPMSYGLRVTIQHLQDEIKGCSTEVQELTTKVCEQEEELSAMQKEVEMASQELGEIKHTLEDITHRLQVVQKQRDCARHQVQESKKKLDVMEADFVHFEQELLEENEELHELIGSLRDQIELLSVRLAVKKRGEVMKAYKEEETKRKKEQQDKMICEKQHMEALKQRATKEEESYQNCT